MADRKPQEIRTQGVIRCLSDMMDKRFVQARRINPRIANVEADIRLHQMATLHDVLMHEKGFGSLRIAVVDVLTAHDEAKKRSLFDAVDQVSIQNEIVPSEDDAGERRAGQLEIRTVQSVYRALDPTLESILELVQMWIWWDLRDAADLYLCEMLSERVRKLKNTPTSPEALDAYRRDMDQAVGDEISPDRAIRFELGRMKGLIDRFERRLADEEGYQMIVSAEEREGSTQTDLACVNLARRLMAIEKLRTQKEEGFDDKVRHYYAGQMRLPEENVTVERAIAHETALAKRDRQALADAMTAGTQVFNTVNYKQVKLDDLKGRFETLCEEVSERPEIPAPSEKSKPTDRTGGAPDAKPAAKQKPETDGEDEIQLQF